MSETIGEALWHLMGSNVDDLEEATRGAFTRNTPLQELLDLVDEVHRLRRWKEEALVVDAMWDEVWIAAGEPEPLGGYKPQNVKAEIQRLQKHKELLRTELAKWGWGDMHYGNQPQDPAIVQLLKETA